MNIYIILFRQLSTFLDTNTHSVLGTLLTQGLNRALDNEKRFMHTSLNTCIRILSILEQALRLTQMLARYTVHWSM